MVTMTASPFPVMGGKHGIVFPTSKSKTPIQQGEETIGAGRACNLWQGSAPPSQHCLQGLHRPTSRCHQAVEIAVEKATTFGGNVGLGKSNNRFTKFTMVYYGLLWFTMVYYGLLWFTMAYYGLLWFTIHNSQLDYCPHISTPILMGIFSKIPPWWIPQKWQGSWRKWW